MKIYPMIVSYHSFVAALLRGCSIVIVTVGLVLSATAASANRVACFDTNLGRFCMELFERQAPETVANLIRYIDNDTYNQNIFHRSIPGFVVQGGGFQVAANGDSARISAVETFDPIVNEFGFSNVRGTVAMAKLGSDPNSATSQWFINLADNSANLDFQNEGFTVFAQILFDGMTLFDTIAGLQRVDFGGALSSTPTVDFDVSQPVQVENFVRIENVELFDVTAAFNQNALTFVVDIGANQLFGVRLQLVEAAPRVVFAVDLDSVAPLSPGTESTAIYSAQNQTLTLPSVMVNASSVVNNVVMSLTDAQQLQFTVISIGQ